MPQIDRAVGSAVRSEVIGRNGMVCSCQPLCSQVGLDILRQGGNAIDAAIATNIALGLMDPRSCGLGGDLFAIVYHAKTDGLFGLESVGRSPGMCSYEHLMKDLTGKNYKKIPITGPLSVSVPGAVAGWYELSEKFGKMDMGQLFQPTIEYAKNGFPVTEFIAQEWKMFEGTKGFGDFRKVYFPEGKAPKYGELFKNPDLAKTMKKIAKHGPDAFYSGEIGDSICDFMKENGGFLEKSDFVRHKSTGRDLISTTYRGYDVYEMPFPGQGTSVLQMLNILEHFDIQEMALEERVHTMIEAKKIVFEDRAKYYADPDFSTTVPLIQDRIISKKYGDTSASLIHPTASQIVTCGTPDETFDETSGNTVYLTTADKDGNMVSLIQSIYHAFGSQVVVPGTGFCLQNRGHSFSLDPTHPNCYAQGKRPFHTIIPGFVTKHSRPYFSFGVMGGDMQPQGQLQVLSNIIDLGMNVQEAGDAPRWRHLASSEPTENRNTHLKNGGFVLLESGLAESVGEGLRNRGHRVLDRKEFFGGYQGIMVKDGVYFGGTESRQDGQVCVY